MSNHKHIWKYKICKPHLLSFFLFLFILFCRDRLTKQIQTQTILFLYSYQTSWNNCMVFLNYNLFSMVSMASKRKWFHKNRRSERLQIVKKKCCTVNVVDLPFNTRGAMFARNNRCQISKALPPCRYPSWRPHGREPRVTVTLLVA